MLMFRSLLRLFWNKNSSHGLSHLTMVWGSVWVLNVPQRLICQMFDPHSLMLEVQRGWDLIQLWYLETGALGCNWIIIKVEPPRLNSGCLWGKTHLYTHTHTYTPCLLLCRAPPQDPATRNTITRQWSNGAALALDWLARTMSLMGLFPS